MERIHSEIHLKSNLSQKTPNSKFWGLSEAKIDPVQPW